MTKHEEAMAAAADKAAEHVAALSMGDKPGGAEGSAPGVPAGAAPAAAASRIVGAAAADTTHGLSPADAGVASGLPGYIADEDANLGTFIANRLLEVGVRSVFAVPGDFNLLLLDQLVKARKKGLDMVWCCNELNAGYAADGYARRRGAAALVVTFCVGGLSALNAVAGAASEDLPLIVISGAPNSNDYASARVLHHTTGLPEYGQQMRAFREATCCQVSVRHIEEAAAQVDYAISEALLRRKPAYIEVSCNLADLHHPSFQRLPVPYSLPQRHTNAGSLAAAVETALAALSKAAKPVLLAGARLRSYGACEAFAALCKAAGYGVAVLPDAKGMVDEQQDTYMGMYWGAASSPTVCEVVEAADCVVAVGCVWTDYSTVGYSTLLAPNKLISVEPSRVTVCAGPSFGCVRMDDFLNALAAKVQRNDTTYKHFKRMHLPPTQPARLPRGAPLTTNVLYKHIQGLVSSRAVGAVLSEVGDAWFNTLKLALPTGTSYELQLRYGSIGWSVGAALGYAVGERDAAAVVVKNQPAGQGQGQGGAGSSSSSGGGSMMLDKSSPGRRLLAVIGDGSFQMTAQEVSTMMRYYLNPIIVLVNNGAYTIEVEIHDGPYNVIQNWDYCAFVKAMAHHPHPINDAQAAAKTTTAATASSAGGSAPAAPAPAPGTSFTTTSSGGAWCVRVCDEEGLEAALKEAASAQHAQQLVLIEALVARDDCSRELLEWGSRVAAANGRKHVDV